MSLRLVLASSSGRLGTSARYLATLPRRSRLERGLVASAATGVFSLIDPHLLTPVQRSAHRMVSGALAGAVGADLAREDPMIDPVTDGVLLGGAALALAGPAEQLDTWAARQLQRRGVPHPRLLFAALAAGATALSYAVATHRERDSATWSSIADGFEQARERELPAAARDLIAALLGAGESGADEGGAGQEGQPGAELPGAGRHGAELPGAAALREQLEQAREIIPDFPTSDVMLAVPEPVRLAVPHSQVWPVRAAFTRGGMAFGLSLHITEGRLDVLQVMLPQDERLIDAALAILDADPSLPRPEELELLREGEDPTAPPAA